MRSTEFNPISYTPFAKSLSLPTNNRTVLNMRVRAIWLSQVLAGFARGDWPLGSRSANQQAQEDRLQPVATLFYF